MEEKKVKRIGAYKVLSNETLKRETKAGLIERIRILEHNWASTEESFNNSVRNSEKIYYEQKAEIEEEKHKTAYWKERAEKWKQAAHDIRKETAKKFASGFINDILPKIMNGHSEKALQIAMAMANYCEELTEGKQ